MGWKHDKLTEVWTQRHTWTQTNTRETVTALKKHKRTDGGNRSGDATTVKASEQRESSRRDSRGHTPYNPQGYRSRHTRVSEKFSSTRNQLLQTLEIKLETEKWVKLLFVSTAGVTRPPEPIKTGRGEPLIKLFSSFPRPSIILSLNYCQR